MLWVGQLCNCPLIYVYYGTSPHGKGPVNWALISINIYLQDPPMYGESDISTI